MPTIPIHHTENPVSSKKQSQPDLPSSSKPTTAELIRVAVAFGQTTRNTKARTWRCFTAEIVEGPVTRKYFMMFLNKKLSQMWPLQCELSYKIVVEGKQFEMMDMRLVGPDPKPDGNWDHKYFSTVDTGETPYEECTHQCVAHRQSDWPTLRVFADGTIEEHPLTWAEWNESIHTGSYIRD